MNLTRLRIARRRNRPPPDPQPGGAVDDRAAGPLKVYRDLQDVDAGSHPLDA